MTRPHGTNILLKYIKLKEEINMKFIQMVFGFLAVMTTNVLAGSHMTLWNASGVQVEIISNTSIEGSSGSIQHISSKDIWDYANAPQGFPRAVEAICHNVISFDSDKKMLGGYGSCEMMADPDGDVALYLGTFGADGAYSGSQISGTGKYASYNGSKFEAGWTGQLPDGRGVYSFGPKK